MAERGDQTTKDEAIGERISGGHLVAKALKNEGVDTISMPRSRDSAQDLLSISKRMKPLPRPWADR